MNIKLLRFWIVIISLFFSANVSFGAVTDLGQIERQGILVRPIAITGNNPDVTSIAQKAFSLHGGFKIVPVSNASFVLDFQKVNASTIQLTIKSSGQMMFSQTFTASDIRKATLIASDVAVEKILGTPGFFAGQIAFIGERVINKRDVYVSDMLFLQAEPLTHDGAHALAPNWSPDSRSILYTSYFKSGSADIFKIDVNTKRRMPFAVYQGTNMCPAYSPGGNQVAMILSGKGNAALYTSNANGQNPKRLTHNRASETSPTWSPDGSQIVLASDIIGRPQLFLLDLRQGQNPQPKRLPITISSYCAEPAWNPTNPNLIAFTYRSPNGFQIATYNLATHETQAVTQGPHEALEPCWTRDGRHLIFTQRIGYKLRLYILDTLSGKTTPLHSEKFGRTAQADYTYMP